jgi:hypothetical protein
MPSPFRRSLPITGVAVAISAAVALAETPAGAAPHVRPETPATRSLLQELTARSGTARALVDELDHSRVIVYVRHRLFTSMVLDGRTGLLQSEGPTRFVIVELACGRTRLDELVTLGHELTHAVEIARAPLVVDARSLSAHFSRIGMRTSGMTENATYETAAAIEMSTLLRKELIGSAVRTTHDRD